MSVDEPEVSDVPIVHTVIVQACACTSPTPTYPFKKIPEHHITTMIQSIFFTMLDLNILILQRLNGKKNF